ncbi:MAG: hypothetical protein INR70_15670 [Parafilimonas terrae]|nr:hypothetical protein [Parafilimonas terrae]
MSEASDAAERHIALGDFEAAEEIAAAALRDAPLDAASRLALATTLAKQLRFEPAIDHCLDLLHRTDLNRGARLGAIRVLACCATQLGEPDMARPHIEAAGFERASDPVERCWHPRILAKIGATEEAYHALVALAKDIPGDPFITGILGQTMQERGDAGGLRLELALMGRAFFQRFFPHAPAPERIWEGEHLAGRSIALLPQGGFGDLFDCIRYARRLKALGAGRVTAIMGEKCRRLTASAGVDEMVDLSEANLAIGRADLWAPVPGLKRVALSPEGRAVETGGYLTAPKSTTAEALAQEMRSRAAGRPCLGLYWHSDRDLGEHKSIPLPALAPIIARGDVHWVILQRGFGLRQWRRAEFGAGATLVGDDLSFDETAALMAQLDGVVSICAWAFHLAGALGLRTWLLAGRVMDCRHLNRERDSVLYADCASLVRQHRIGDWAGAVTRLNAELDAFTLPAASARGSSGSSRPGILAG